MKCRVRAVIEHSGKLLLVKHVGHQTWCLPGGGVDEGEDLIAAMRRETIEELGIEPEIGPMLVVHQYKQNGVFEGPEFFFRITNPEDFLEIDLTKTTHGAAEIAEFGFFDAATVENARPSLLNTIQFDDTCPAVVLE